MRHTFPKLLAATALGAMMLSLLGAGSTAQEPIPLFPPGGAQPPVEAQPAQPEGSDVLARGPVHEAFATTSEAPAAARMASNTSGGIKLPPSRVNVPAALIRRRTPSRA